MAEYTREEVLEMVRAGKSLEGAQLRGLDLSEADIREANLCYANLVFVNFNNADLSGANLNGAALAGADLRQANLNKTDFSETDLGGVNIAESDLCEANLSGAELGGATLTYVNLSEAVLRDADLASVDLEGAILNNADISGANIYHIKTPGWKIENIKCTHIYCYYPFTTNIENREKNRKESRRDFGEGEFEAIYKSMPTIELWFRDKFSFTDELRLMDIQRRLQREVPEAHISLKKKEWVGKDMVITLTVEEEDKAKEAAEAVDRLYRDEGLKRKFLRWWKKVSHQLLPGLEKTLTNGTAAEVRMDSSDIINNPSSITYNIYGDGHTFVHANSVKNSAIGPGASVTIIRNYQNNQPAVDVLLKALRAGLAEDRKDLVDQFTAALKAKDERKVNSKWDKVRSGIGTTSNLVSIASGITQLLGLYLKT